MPKKKSKREIDSVLKDWNGKEILLPTSVIEKHLWDAAHDTAFEYIETLKENISSPESVYKSDNRGNTCIANIALKKRKHKYLRVVIRYESFFGRLRKKKNFIVTFYTCNDPIGGQKIWPK